MHQNIKDTHENEIFIKEMHSLFLSDFAHLKK